MSKKRVSLEQRENMSKPITSTISTFISQNEMNSDTLFDTKDSTKSDNEIAKDNDINKLTDSDTKKVTNNITEDVTENVTKVETKVQYTKKIQIGSETFKSIYSGDDDLKRAAYFLREDTIEKIEKCAKLSGLKKYEFVDLVLNNILTDILNKVNKND